MDSTKPYWYIIYTKPRQEKNIYKQLLDNQIESFFPQYKTLRQWHDRKKLVTRPLFPNYIFVFINTGKEFINILKINGVCGFVKMGKAPAKVAGQVIDQMKMLENEGKNINVLPNYFKKGQKLCIQNGPLSDLVCEVVVHNKMKKILVRMDIFNRCILSDIPLEMFSVEERA